MNHIESLGPSVLAVVVTLATLILYWRSRRFPALVMVIGVATLWLALGLMKFGPRTEFRVPREESASTLETPDERSRGDIETHVVLYRPMAIASPMWFGGLALFAVGLLVFSWGTDRKDDD